MKGLSNIKWYDSNGVLVESYDSPGDSEHTSILCSHYTEENSITNEKPQWKTFGQWTNLSNNTVLSGWYEFRIQETDGDQEGISLGMAVIDSESPSIFYMTATSHYVNSSDIEITANYTVKFTKSGDTFSLIKYKNGTSGASYNVQYR